MLEWIISSAVLTAIVIALRLVFKGRMSLRLQYALWLLVLVRLLVPFSFGSTAWSVQNLLDRTTQTPKVSDTARSDAKTGTPAASVEASGFKLEGTDAQKIGINVQAGPAEREAAPEGLRIEVTPAEEPSFAVTDILMIAWGAGAGLVALWLLLTNLHFYFKLRRSRERLDVDNAPLPVYVTDGIDTPCLFGLIKPMIFVTPEVAEDDTALRFSIAHEATHYRHGDHFWSLLRGLCLAIHWYNPLVWIAAILSRNDAELACDEATIRRIGEEQRADYGRTLIQLTCEKRPAIFLTATTMTGSGRGIKERIKLIVKKPKTAVITLIAILLVIAIAVGCTFTGAKPEVPDSQTTDADLPRAEQKIPADANVIGQAMYGGLLYDVPDVTTGVAFEEKQEFLDAVLIPPMKTPMQSLECNVPGKSASFAVVNGKLILIVDGTQYDLANTEKIIATITPIRRIDHTDDPDEQLASTAWPQAKQTAQAIACGISQDRYYCYRWESGADVIFPGCSGTQSVVVSLEQTANGAWALATSDPVSLIDNRRKDVVAVSDAISNSEGSDRLAPVIDFARDYAAQMIDYWNEKTGNPIKEAVITGVSKQNTGLAALTYEIPLYLLEYRLLPEDQAHITLAEGMKTEEIGGQIWITGQSSGGQPYLLMARSTSDDWLRICTLDTATIERISGAEISDDACRAAASQLFHAFDGKGALTPELAVQSLFASGEITLTLYLEDGTAWKTLAADDPLCEDRITNWMSAFLWTRLDAMPDEPREYRITALSADGTKRMTFRADGGAGTVEYSDGNTTSVWSAQPTGYAQSAVALIRDMYDGLEVDFSEFRFRFEGDAEKAAEYFVTTAVGEHLQTLAPGSSYGVDDYEVVRWEVKSVSSDETVVEGGFSCAFVPWDPGDPETGRAGNLLAGNTQEGTGKYAGKLVFYRQFVLQLESDGLWHCTGFSTG